MGNMKKITDYTEVIPNSQDVLLINQNGSNKKTTVEKLLDGVNSSLSENTQNIAQLSNPNLLINGDFQVWQRGTSFTDTYQVYTADRWYSQSSNNQLKIEKVTNGMKVTALTDNSTFFLYQKLEDTTLDKLNGKKLTKSISVDGFVTNTTYICDGTNALTYSKTLNNGQSMIINWVKLELGSIATPFVPRLYGEELALCQRYYQGIYVSGIAMSATLLACNYQFNMSMRTSPTPIIGSSNLFARGIGTIDGGVLMVSCDSTRVGQIDASNLTVGRFYETSSQVYFDAEIY